VLNHLTTLRRSKCLLDRRGLAAALGVAVLLGGTPSEALSQQTLNVATWGGAYGRAQEEALFEPFAKKTGTVVATEIYGGDAEKLKSLIGDSDTPVDVVDVSAGALDKLCADGLLAPLDGDELKGGGGGDDFLPGAISKCGVASMAWSTAIVFSRKAFRTAKPESIAALLDTAAYPGKRALPNTPQRTLELALLADGVPPGSVYTELGTPEGADRAFAALDKIKNHVLLWDNAAQPVTWIVDGRAAMAAGYSGRLFRAAIGDRNIGILWDGQIYDLDAWAIPKTSKNKAEAMRFIRFATEPAQLAAQAQLTAYGPMRASAIAQVGPHPVIGVDMQSFLPTAPGNFQRALKFDQAWWDRSGASLTQRFNAWANEVRTAAAAREAERKAKAAAAAAKDAPAKAAP